MTGDIFGWSRWVFVIVSTRGATRTDAEIKAAAADFGGKTFGGTFGITVYVYIDRSITIDVRTKGHAVMDPRYVEQMTERWRQWAIAGFGEHTELTLAMATPTDEPKGAPMERIAS